MVFTQDKIEQIKEASPIEEVIGEYIQLKKTGKNLRGLCPFHSEKTPSFFVSQEKDLYHCFGCGKSGNVVTFVMEYKGMQFPEAIKFLADRAGIKVDVKKGIEYKYKNLYEVNEWTANFYHNVLMSKQGTPGREYFKNRGISDGTIKEFLLGYAPYSGNVLISHAKQKNISLSDLEILGLISKNGGSYYSRFRAKIIFPIKNTWERVIGFGTRVIDDSLPKYINSQETPIFKKGKGLYGLAQTRNEIRKKDRVILVEGYMDFLALYQYGIKNIAASLGTSLNLDQAQVIKRYTDNVTILYDSDEPGEKAADRAISVLVQSSLSVRIAELKKDYDPDKFIRKKGKDALVSLLERADDFVEFKLRNCQTVEQKVSITKEFQEILASIPDEVKRELWANKISEKMNIKKEYLFTGRKGASSTGKTVYSSTGRTNILPVIEIELLALATKSDRVAIMLKGSIDLLSPEIKSVAELVLKGMEPSRVVDFIEEVLPQDKYLKEKFTEIIIRDNNIDVQFLLARDYINKLKKIKLKSRMEQIRKNGLLSTREGMKEFQSLKTGLLQDF